jgi:hypothetical protein
MSGLCIMIGGIVLLGCGESTGRRSQERQEARKFPNRQGGGSEEGQGKGAWLAGCRRGT